MTLLARTTARAGRIRQALAEHRLDEIVAVASISGDYTKIDKPGDAEIIKAFTAVYRLMDDDEERQAVVDAFNTWRRIDARKDAHVHGSTDDAVTLMKDNNPIWLNGAATPDGSDGVA